MQPTGSGAQASGIRVLSLLVPSLRMSLPELWGLCGAIEPDLCINSTWGSIELHNAEKAQHDMTCRALDWVLGCYSTCSRGYGVGGIF